MSEHTKEKWKQGSPDYGIIYQDGGEGIYDVVVAITEMHSDETDANAKRIVACVNACAGISNEQLNNWMMIDGNILNVIKRQTEYLNTVEKTNQELVELLTEARDDVAAKVDEYQQLLPYKQHRYDAQKETLDRIDEALAKAKEQP